MKTEQFSCKAIVKDGYDVIVAGGGPSGSAAAIAAARAGAKTLLIEKNICLGGMWTAGLVNPLFDHSNKVGIMQEIYTRLVENNAWGGFWGISFQYERMKWLLDEMTTAAGVTVLFDTVVTGVKTDNDAVVGLFTHSKEGLCYYPAKIVIDCTGDADVTALSGAEIKIGREKDGGCQAATLMFLIGNVRFVQKDAKELCKLITEAVETHGLDYKIPFNHPFVINVPGTDTAVVQLTHMRGYNTLSGTDFSAAVTEGRRQAMQTFEIMKNYVPQFKDITLLQTAAMLGVRESRRIVGEYTLQLEDLVQGKKFSDSICICAFGIDIHEPDSDVQTNLHSQPYGIPYRCLIPKGVKNLLVAGRTISGTHEAMASYRVTGDCVAMGEAAGCAAYEAIAQNKDVREVSINEIKRHIANWTEIAENE